MKKIFVVIGIVGVVGFVWFLIHSSTVDHVATVDDELSRIESELASVNAEVIAGTLTSEDALRSKEKLATRLGTIKDSVSASHKYDLSDPQTKMLEDSLDRLKGVLIEYQATLSMVDETVEGVDNTADEQALLQMNETIALIEDYVAEVIEGYIPDKPIVLEGEIATTTDQVVGIDLEETATTSSSTNSVDLETDLLQN